MVAKPRIKRCAVNMHMIGTVVQIQAWCCEGLGYTAIGISPADAYAQWQHNLPSSMPYSIGYYLRR